MKWKEVLDNLENGNNPLLYYNYDEPFLWRTNVLDQTRDWN